MEKTVYKTENIEIVKLEKKKGLFKTEEGREIPYKSYWVYFKHKDNPLVYRAKLDKVFGEYFDDLVSDAVAESEPASEFWG